MQKVAAYLLERRDGMSEAQARKDEHQDVLAAVSDWLLGKGAAKGETSGLYRAEDGSRARFDREDALDGERSWSMFQLDEVAAVGDRFLARVSVTTTHSGVTVYVSLEAGSAVSLVAPVEVDPLCPRIVRSLIESSGRWFHGESQVHRLRHARSFEDGEEVAAEIADPRRTVPIVVVTADAYGLALPRLDERVAYDLVGLANVVSLDADPTWALTDAFGKSLSCYSGAIRLFWPRFSTATDPYSHPLWTATRLRNSGDDQTATRERFRRQLRGLVMRASALSVVRPAEIDEIRKAASQRSLSEMRARAASLEDFVGLAQTYAEDNDKLVLENAELRDRVAELEAGVAGLAGIGERQVVPTEIPPASRGDEQDIHGPPQEGETRYYKKRYAAPAHDVLLRVPDCGCNTWRPAPKAEKAKKGISRLESGRSGWKTLHHCGACSGGGMWKVRW